MFRQFFRRVHRPDSTAETRVNIKKPFDSADNKHHARILIFNIAPEFQMRHPYIPSQHHISPLHVLSSPSKDILYIYTRLFAVKISINASSSSLARRRKQQRLTRTRMEILIAINQLPPLQIFSFGGTIKLTSAKCVSDLLCATVPPSLFSTHWGKPLFRSVARTLVTRTQLDRVSIEGPSFSSLFCPASR